MANYLPKGNHQMTMTLRLITICLIASISLFFSIISFNNLTDYDSNWFFVQHVMSMDTTFKNPAIMWRAITQPGLMKCAYYFIIAWEITTATLCWIGTYKLIANIHAPVATFTEAKKIAFIGLFFGCLLYLLGFIIIGGEWFNMWQSATWNAQMKSGLFFNMIMFVLIFLKIEE